MHSLWIILLVAICSINICNAKHKYKKLHHNHHPERIHCFSEEELENSPTEVVNHFVGSKMHWDRNLSVQLVQNLEDTEKRSKRRRRASDATCPEMKTLVKGETLNERSISPWTYRIDIDENRYPQKLAFAHCLCKHCISSESGMETSSLNSVPVKQTMLVLLKKTCPSNSSLYTFRLEYISVPVACTCSVPRY